MRDTAWTIVKDTGLGALGVDGASRMGFQGDWHPWQSLPLALSTLPQSLLETGSGWAGCQLRITIVFVIYSPHGVWARPGSFRHVTCRR